MKKVLMALAATVSIAACDASKDELTQKVAELQLVSAQKDSLIQEVMSTTQFVGDLTSDLAAVKALNAGRPVASEVADVEGKTPAQMRATVRERVRELAQRVEQSETRLAQSRARVQSLSGSNAEMQAQLAVYDSTISALRVVIEGQKTEISALSEQVLGLQQTNVMLAARGDTLAREKDQLTNTVNSMTVEGNKAYYIVGTAKELLDRGIITKKGGILGMGSTLTPARALKEEDFTEIDRMRDSVITFPDSIKPYRFVSLQDTRYLEVQPDKDNHIRSGLKISSPEQFWATSKFLILVQR
jgi:hypothetical protein